MGFEIEDLFAGHKAKPSTTDMFITPDGVDYALDTLRLSMLDRGIQMPSAIVYVNSDVGVYQAQILKELAYAAQAVFQTYHGVVGLNAHLAPESTWMPISAFRELKCLMVFPMSHTALFRSEQFLGLGQLYSNIEYFSIMQHFQCPPFNLGFQFFVDHSIKNAFIYTQPGAYKRIEEAEVRNLHD